MKSRIQEALRRRHRRGDEGFTLIELLVVILIIAILAAVGIVALLSALNAGKKSAAKTSLRNAITSIKASQTGAGQTDFAGIGIATGAGLINMTTEDPDLQWQTGAITTNGTNVISLSSTTGEQIGVATRSDTGVCYYVQMNANVATRYGSAAGGAGGCNGSAALTAANVPATNTKAGWNL